MTHYVENIGTEDVVFIEVLQADHFSGKWLIIQHRPTVADLCGRCYP
jgi:oxalate decarboxylase/phosphoglucose isomerase-like protein (cupin superfamily)